jgi:2-oxoglutarate dehydrogenase E2 component (dihydrolipoamide succinyltransferase)
MATVEMVMPKMGESIMEGTILTWLKKEGDAIEEEEAVLEVATDKVDTEVPSSYAGILKKILAQEGEVVAVGKPIAILEIDGDVSEAAVSSKDESSSTVEAAAAYVDQAKATVDAAPETKSDAKSDRFYSPLVLNIAKTEQITRTELDKIAGSGQDGRVTKHDMLSYLESRKSGATASAVRSQNTDSRPVATSAPITVSGEDEIIEMDRMRKMIAERMVASKQISPHVTSFVEADVTNLVKWRAKMKHLYADQEGQALTFTPVFIEAVVKAIKDFPLINISVDGNKIIKRGSVNIGMAVALPSGNLIVPVIHNADQLSLLGIVKKVNDLSKRARENKLKPDELSGGTYTVTNVGSFGNVMGTPIIMQPQVAIMATGAIQKKPAVIETPEGDFIGIRSKMFLSHSYDHRVVDGALGGKFVRRVADYLENFDVNRTF